MSKPAPDVAALVERWRATARQELHVNEDVYTGQALARKECADELEAALSRTPPPAASPETREG